MYIAILILLAVIFFQQWQLHKFKDIVSDSLRMLDALSKICKAMPDYLDDPQGYAKKCQDAAGEMARIAVNCILTMNKTESK